MTAGHSSKQPPVPSSQGQDRKRDLVSVQVERPGRKPELESDVHPPRHPEEPPMPNESDNIPGDENAPTLVQGKG